MFQDAIPANTRHSLNDVSMLAQRPRRCPSIETALGQCSVFVEIRIPSRSRDCPRQFSMSRPSLIPHHYPLRQLMASSPLMTRSAGDGTVSVQCLRCQPDILPMPVRVDEFDVLRRLSHFTLETNIPVTHTRRTAHALSDKK